MLNGCDKTCFNTEIITEIASTVMSSNSILTYKYIHSFQGVFFQMREKGGENAAAWYRWKSEFSKEDSVIDR